MPVDITKGDELAEVPVGKAPVELVETVVKEGGSEEEVREGWEWKALLSFV